VILGTFFLSILGIKHTRDPVTAAPAPVPGDGEPSTGQPSTGQQGTASNHREQPAASPRL
jgi:hypothetical protein